MENVEEILIYALTFLVISYIVIRTVRTRVAGTATVGAEALGIAAISSVFALFVGYLSYNRIANLRETIIYALAFSAIAYISIRAIRTRVAGTSKLGDEAQVIAAIAAVLALFATYLSYKSSAAAELTKASVEVRRNFIHSIDADAKAAIALLTSSQRSKCVAFLMVRSLPIHINDDSIQSCRGGYINVQRNFGYLVRDGSIDGKTVNRLRFSLVRLLNEYENTVILLNNGAIDCVHVFDILVDLIDSSSFNGIKRFIDEYRSLEGSGQRVGSGPWGAVIKFNEEARQILLNINQERIFDRRFCEAYSSSHRNNGNALFYLADI